MEAPVHGELVVERLRHPEHDVLLEKGSLSEVTDGTGVRASVSGVDDVGDFLDGVFGSGFGRHGRGVGLGEEFKESLDAIRPEPRHDLATEKGAVMADGEAEKAGAVFDGEGGARLGVGDKAPGNINSRSDGRSPRPAEVEVKALLERRVKVHRVRRALEDPGLELRPSIGVVVRRVAPLGPVPRGLETSENAKDFAHEGLAHGEVRHQNGAVVAEELEHVQLGLAAILVTEHFVREIPDGVDEGVEEQCRGGAAVVNGGEEDGESGSGFHCLVERTRSFCSGVMSS
jgi:hypothetical protein